MGLRIVVPPAIEPITLAEAKAHLRLDSTTFEADVNALQSILSGAYTSPSPNFGLVGTGIDVSEAASILALLTVGIMSPGSTLVVKLQHSNDDIDYEDVGLGESPMVTGIFPVVTDVNDQAIYELSYGGTMRYVRAVADLIGDADFGVSILLDSPQHVEDALIQQMISAARERVENTEQHAHITQTIDLTRDGFPRALYLRPPLQYVEFIEIRNGSDTPEIISLYDPSTGPIFETADYLIDIVGNRIVRKGIAGGSAGSSICASKFSASNTQSVLVRFVSGYGDNRSDVPSARKAKILIALAELYENRGDAQGGNMSRASQTANERAIENLADSIPGMA